MGRNPNKTVTLRGNELWKITLKSSRTDTVSLRAEAKKLREPGEKRPAVKTWSEYQTRPMADRELERFREAVL